MQKLILGIAAVVLSASAGAVDFSGSVGYASDYIWRGITKSNGEQIFNGSGRLAHDSGAYVNVNFFTGVDYPAATDQSQELDYTVGFAKDVGDGLFSLDVGYSRHTYIGDERDDAVGELHGMVSKGPANVTVFRVIGEDEDQASYVVGSVSATELIKQEMPVDVSVFYGTQLPVEDDDERVSDYGMVASVGIKDRGSLSYKLSKLSEDEEVTHSVGVTIKF